MLPAACVRMSNISENRISKKGRKVCVATHSVPTRRLTPQLDPSAVMSSVSSSSVKVCHAVPIPP